MINTNDGKRAIAHQIKGRLSQSPGELRVWGGVKEAWCKVRLQPVAQQNDNDKWQPPCLRQFLLSTENEGQMKVAKTADERLGKALEDVFDHKYDSGDCSPDFNNALSTVAVWDKNGRELCMRCAIGASLGEIFWELGHTSSYSELYNRFKQGRILIYPRIERWILCES